MLNLFSKIHNLQKSAFRLFSFVLFLFLLNQSFAPLFAKENWKEFLEALENRQYYEEALDYLDSLSNDPNTDSRILTELPDRIAKIKQKISNKSKESVLSPNLSYKNINALSDSTIPNETSDLESSQNDLPSLKLDQINSFYEAVDQCNILFAALVKLNNEKNANLSEESNSKNLEQKKNLALQLDQAIRLALNLSERPETLEAERKNNNKTVLRDSSNKSLEMQILNLRFQWAYLSLVLERNEDAMILGTYIARNNTDFSNVISAAEIAMQSCKNLYTEFQNDPNFSSEDQTQSFLFINDKVAEFTDFILKNWNSAQSPEKQEFVQKILLFRINIAISSNNIEIAQQFFQQLSDSSDLKAIGELRLGLALWIKWLENAQKQENGQNLSNESESEDSATNIEKQKELLNQAKAFLDSGLHRKIELNNGFDRVDYLSSYSALILANILFLQNDFDAAWQWLNHPQIGPNKLTQESIQASKGVSTAQNNDLSTDNSVDSEANKTVVLPDFLDESFQTKTLILALRLYINGQQFDKAEETINDLESFYTSNKSELVLVYIQIGKQLEDQIRQLSQSSNNDQLTEITTTFELFLDRLSNKSDENDYMTLRWIGDTYMSFGKGLFGSLTEPSEEAQNYFTKAGRIYQKIRKKIQEDAHWAGIDNAETATVLRLSQCLCAIGRQEKALPLLIELLEQSETVLELQIEAANVYQSMGRISKDNYIRAIVGEYKKENGQNLIWGWNGIIYRISRKINDQSQLTDFFYEAMTNKMFCRYSYIRTLNDKNEITKQAKDAEKELLRFQQTYPDLGGINWKKKLEAQLKQFRRLQGQINPQGF